MAINHQSILKVFNTEDGRQQIFKYKIKYNKPPIYLKLYLPLKYILYIASLMDRTSRWICIRGMLRSYGYYTRDKEQLVKCKMNDDRMIYLYNRGDFGEGYTKDKCFKIDLDEYNKYSNQYELELKIINIWRKYAKKTKLQPCPYCNKIMNKTSIRRHIKSQHREN